MDRRRRLGHAVGYGIPSTDVAGISLVLFNK
jgi:hypothetical protein